ncbi:hypothetical protein QWZ06_17845 [Chryseobacterium tructae]|uniref:Uncharacterized protein n=1 Tax=Chryseobacterium tructae TaxID=1037380 RepID=A0ABV7Y2K1_9FLAO|nr:hypothetical protein [Chryseobacterium tructae]MDN3694004.1 hypothetical protein [Chryseobacterium tructae]
MIPKEDVDIIKPLKTGGRLKSSIVLMSNTKNSKGYKLIIS